MPRSLYLRFRRGTAAAWAAANSVLGAGEPAFETDTGTVKVGDGSTAYGALGALASQSYAAAQAALRTRYQGAWVSGTSYAVNDVVTYNNQLYVCTTAVNPVASSYVGSSKISSTTAATANLPLPTGSAAGDFMLIAQSVYGSSGPVIPSGSSSVATAVNANGHYGVASRTLTSADITAGYITIPAQVAGSLWVAIAQAFRNVSGVDTSSIGQTTNNTSPSIVPTGAAYVVSICWNLHDTTGDGTMTQSGVLGLVTQGTPATAFGPCAGMGYEVVNSGASTTRTFTTAGNGAVPDAASIAVLTTGFDFSKWAFIANVDANLPPTGSVMAYAGSAAPAGYLLCDGTSYLRSVYPALFAIIGTSYGSADVTHFTVPDLRARVPIGKAAATFTTLGQTGGGTTHTHTLTAAWAKITGAGSNFALLRNVVTSWTANIQGPTETIANSTLSENTGSGLGGSTDAGDHTPPYQVVNYIIKT